MEPLSYITKLGKALAMNFLSDSAVLNFILLFPIKKKNSQPKGEWGGNQPLNLSNIWTTSNNFSDYNIYVYSCLDFCLSGYMYVLKPQDSELEITGGKAFVSGVDNKALSACPVWRSGSWHFLQLWQIAVARDLIQLHSFYVSCAENLFLLPVFLHSGLNSYVAAWQYSRKNKK